MTLGLWIAIALVGGAGAVARTVLTGSSAARTVAANVAGAFAVGILSGADVGGESALLAGTAFLGAFTTFSTWMLDVAQRWSDGDRSGAVALLTGALALGLVAAASGRMAGGLL